jgi:hypothetical protein
MITISWSFDDIILLLLIYKKLIKQFIRNYNKNIVYNCYKQTKKAFNE